MYPLLQEGTLNRCIEELENAQYIKIISTNAGINFLELGIEGKKFLNHFSESKQKSGFKRVLKGIASGMEFFAAINQIFPMI